MPWTSGHSIFLAVRFALPASTRSLSSIAETYIKLVLAVGRHDPDYVDAYYGPPELKAEADALGLALPDVERHAREAIARIEKPATGLERLRNTFLRRQLEALVTRVQMLRGARLSFDDEARALYDATPPVHTEEHFERIVERLDAELPGRGAIPARYVAYRGHFVIPPDKLERVFQTAIAAGRERTARYVPPPPNDSFIVEYVTDKPWSGYNWYLGGYRSVIQVNTSLPIYIDRAVDLACHEGYPGHHVYNARLEQKLVRERGWLEFTVYPLFSPQSLIAEGTANYGIEMAFPGDTRTEFERTTIFPLAHLPPEDAGEYYAIQALVRELSYAGNEAARRYLNGEISADAAVAWLERYALMAPAAARQRIRFFDAYRSYVINYNLGQDLVRSHVERTAGPDASDDERWRVFVELLSTPTLPSQLAVDTAIDSASGGRR